MQAVSCECVITVNVGETFRCLPRLTYTSSIDVILELKSREGKADYSIKGTITVRLSTDDTEKPPDGTPQTDAIPIFAVGQSERRGIAKSDNIMYSESVGATDANTKTTQPGDLGTTLESISAILDRITQIAGATSIVSVRKAHVHEASTYRVTTDLSVWQTCFADEFFAQQGTLIVSLSNSSLKPDLRSLRGSLKGIKCSLTLSQPWEVSALSLRLSNRCRTSLNTLKTLSITHSDRS